MRIHRTSTGLVIIDYPPALLSILTYEVRKPPTWYELNSKKFIAPTFNYVKVYVQHPTGGIITPPGVFDAVISWCDKHGVNVTVSGVHIVDPPSHLQSAFKDLRDYQKEALQALTRYGYGMVEIPTGGGKTHLLRALHLAYKLPTLILVPSRELLIQTSKFFESAHLEFGVVGAGTYAPACNTISTYKSAGQLDISSFKVIILDEAHHAASTTLTNLFIGAKTLHRFGLSGTVEGRADNADLLVEALIGPIRYKVTYSVLQSQGFLSTMNCYFIKIPENIGSSHTRQFQLLEKRCIVRYEYRNQVIAEFIKSVPDTHQLIVFCKYVEHVELLGKLTNIPFIHGDMSVKYRKEMLNKLISGEVRKIVTSPVYTEGVNIPGLSVVMNAAGGKGKIPLLQRRGRGSRVTEDKNTCIYVDIYDEGPPILKRHSQKRAATLRANGDVVKYVSLYREIPL